MPWQPAISGLLPIFSDTSRLLQQFSSDDTSDPGRELITEESTSRLRLLYKPRTVSALCQNILASDRHSCLLSCITLQLSFLRHVVSLTPCRSRSSVSSARGTGTARPPYAEDVSSQRKPVVVEGIAKLRRGKYCRPHEICPITPSQDQLHGRLLLRHDGHCDIACNVPCFSCVCHG